MPDQGLIVLCFIAMIALLFLVQLFLSLRSSFVWGLFMPAFFLMLWLYVALNMSFLSFLPFEITLNQVGRNLFITTGICGVLASLAILVCCRIWRKKRAIRKAQEREERRLERQQRLAAEAALRDEEGGLNPSAAVMQQQRVEQARQLADIASERQAEQQAEKRSRKQRPHARQVAKQGSKGVKGWQRTVLPKLQTLKERAVTKAWQLKSGLIDRAKDVQTKAAQAKASRAKTAQADPAVDDQGAVAEANTPVAASGSQPLSHTDSDEHTTNDKIDDEQNKQAQTK